MSTPRTSIPRSRPVRPVRALAGSPKPASADAASPASPADRGAPPAGPPRQRLARVALFATAFVTTLAVLTLFVVLAAAPAAAAVDLPPAAGVGGPEAPAADRHPAAIAAQRAFYASMVRGEPSAEELLVPLLGAYAADPGDPATSLYLGTTYLRLASRGGDGDPHAIAHLVTAERFLERAQRLAPEDARIASFLVPVRLALAQIERAGEARRRELMEELYAAFEADPAFNSFGVAMLGFQSPRGSEPFRRGLEALHFTDDLDCHDDDPTCRNAPGWPHAVEGYLSFYADYELKAGNPQRARDLLETLQGLDSYPDWPYRELAEARLASFDEHATRFADDDPGNDPRPVVFARGCAACHHGS